MTKGAITTFRGLYISHVFTCYATVLLTLTILAVGCAPKIAPFSETAYLQAVELKVISLQLIEQADQPFDEFRDEVNALRFELRKALEFAKGRPHNEYSIGQWEIMADPERNMLAGFLKRWEETGSMSPVFIEEAIINIAAGFDTIIGLESGKIRPGDAR